MVAGEAKAAVSRALDVGYRLIDTSEQYGNETVVGEAIRESPVPREEVFITTKFNARWHGFELAQQAFRASAERLGTDYIDLLLIHWPNPWLDRYVDAWKGMIKLREDGSVRAIGVSNFTPEHIERLLAETGIAPEVNQVELDPTLPQADRRSYHESHGIVTEAWSPLGRAGALLSHPLVKEIAERHGKSTAQVVLRWHIEQGIVVVARSSNAGRIAENIDISDFRLTAEELTAMSALDEGRAPARDPETHGH